jgi:hypothetical protein
MENGNICNLLEHGRTMRAGKEEWSEKVGLEVGIEEKRNVLVS